MTNTQLARWQHLHARFTTPAWIKRHLPAWLLLNLLNWQHTQTIVASPTIKLLGEYLPEKCIHVEQIILYRRSRQGPAYFSSQSTHWHCCQAFMVFYAMRLINNYTSPHNAHQRTVTFTRRRRLLYTTFQHRYHKVQCLLLTCHSACKTISPLYARAHEAWATGCTLRFTLLNAVQSRNVCSMLQNWISNRTFDALARKALLNAFASNDCKAVESAI